MMSFRRVLSKFGQQSMVAPSIRCMASRIESKDLTITMTSNPQPKLPKEQLAFGRTFTDHMLEIDYNETDGWSAPVIKPYGDLSLSPAASSLHYALQCFEGMKAYIDPKTDELRMFRPEMNMQRMQRSGARLCLPPFDEQEFLACIKQLISLDKDWIPKGEGYSLYIRPTYISTDNFIGVAAPKAVKMFCILSPVGPYYPSGFAPIKLLADPANVRAWPGGTGDTKIGSNYATGIKPAQKAMAAGFAQILWLFGDDLQVTEVGTMNQFFFWTTPEGKQELVTAALDGTILPGITRNSILQLCREWGIEVNERAYNLKEVMAACDEGRMIEAFGAGTAAIVSPVNGFTYIDKAYDIPLDVKDPTAKAGPLTQKIMDTIMGIQYGRIPHKWSVVVD